MESAEAQVILISERLLFRPHIMADMDAFCAMEQDAEVRRYVGGNPRSREDAERRFLNGLAQPVQNRLSMWATILKETGRYIGRCGIYPHFDNDGIPTKDEGSLAFYLAHEYWGNGYATEAGRAFIRFGFDELNVKRIVTTIDARNAASIHIIEKLGLTLASTEPGVRTFLHYELTKANYNS